MKIARMAETTQPKFHTPTVRPFHVSNLTQEMAATGTLSTSDPRLMERRRVDNVDLWEPFQEGRYGQETAHDALRIAIASVQVSARIVKSSPQKMRTENTSRK
jgi:hypothetical protein